MIHKEGESMTMNLKPFTPDCGHLVTPVPGSIGTGDAIDPKTGRTMCYPCADEQMKERMRNGEPTGVYVNEDERIVTTWTGATLGKITSLTRGVKRHTRNGPYRMRMVTVTAFDGSTWYGRGSDDMDAVTLRRSR